MPSIFYVDDSHDDLFYVEYLLKKQRLDIDLHCFSTSEAARVELEDLAARGGPLPRLLVVDLYMPLDSGLDLIAGMRADHRFQGMRIGVCSGSDADGDRQRARAAGADFYCEKPIDLQALLTRVE